MNASDISPARISAIGAPAKSGARQRQQPLAHAGEHHQRDGESARGAEVVDRGGHEIVLLLGVDEDQTEHGAVGGDQRQV